MVQNYIYWWANCAVGLPKQRQVHCFGSPTVQLAHQYMQYCTMWPGRAKGLFVLDLGIVNREEWLSNSSMSFVVCYCSLFWPWPCTNKPRSNDRNMPTQHIATLLGATCWLRLATVLRCVATCWVLLPQVWKWPNLSQQHPTRRNTSQQGGQTHATCCAQQCCDMLRWHVAIV